MTEAVRRQRSKAPCSRAPCRVEQRQISRFSISGLSPAPHCLLSRGLSCRTRKVAFDIAWVTATVKWSLTFLPGYTQKHVNVQSLHVHVLLCRAGRAEAFLGTLLKPFKCVAWTPLLWPSEGICVLVSDGGGTARGRSLFVLTCSVASNVLSHK